MSIPPPVYDPPFNITRASHVILAVCDLAASRRFYTEVIGLAVSAERGLSIVGDVHAEVMLFDLA